MCRALLLLLYAIYCYCPIQTTCKNHWTAFTKKWIGSRKHKFVLPIAFNETCTQVTKEREDIQYCWWQRRGSWIRGWWQRGRYYFQQRSHQKLIVICSSRRTVKCKMKGFYNLKKCVQEVRYVIVIEERSWTSPCIIVSVGVHLNAAHWISRH
jgi:hypothetical protein